MPQAEGAGVGVRVEKPRAQAVGVGDGVLLADHPAHRGAEQVEASSPSASTSPWGSSAICAVVYGPGGHRPAAHAAVVEGDDAVALGERGHLRLPRLLRVRQAVDQHQRLLAPAMHLVRELDPVRRHRRHVPLPPSPSPPLQVLPVDRRAAAPTSSMTPANASTAGPGARASAARPSRRRRPPRPRRSPRGRAGCARRSPRAPTRPARPTARRPRRTGWRGRAHRPQRVAVARGLGEGEVEARVDRPVHRHARRRLCRQPRSAAASTGSCAPRPGGRPPARRPCGTRSSRAARRRSAPRRRRAAGKRRGSSATTVPP